MSLSKTSPPRAIAFDFDGVLFESIDVKTEAFRHLFAAEPPPVLQRIIDYHLQNGGLPRFEKFRVIYKDILKRPLPAQQFDYLCNEFSRLVKVRVIASPWVKGAAEFLERNQNKYSFFIVSATPDPEIKSIVEEKRIGTLFKEVFGSPQSKVDLLKSLLNKYSLKSMEVVYVGDARNDWEAAHEVGIRFVWRRLTGQTQPWPGYAGSTILSLDELENVLINA